MSLSKEQYEKLRDEHWRYLRTAKDRVNWVIYASRHGWVHKHGRYEIFERMEMVQNLGYELPYKLRWQGWKPRSERFDETERMRLRTKAEASRDKRFAKQYELLTYIHRDEGFHSGHHKTYFDYRNNEWVLWGCIGRGRWNSQEIERVKVPAGYTMKDLVVVSGSCRGCYLGLIEDVGELSIVRLFKPDGSHGGWVSFSYRVNPETGYVHGGSHPSAFSFANRDSVVAKAVADMVGAR